MLSVCVGFELPTHGLGNQSRPVLPVRSRVFSVNFVGRHSDQITQFGHEYAPQNAPHQRRRFQSQFLFAHFTERQCDRRNPSPIWAATLALRQKSRTVMFETAAETLEFFELAPEGYHYPRLIQGFKRIFSATIFFGTGEHSDGRAMIDWARFHFSDQMKL